MHHIVLYFSPPLGMLHMWLCSLCCCTEQQYCIVLYCNSFQWAFGVLLWECYTCGGVPYAAVQNHKLEDYLTKQNKRLYMPEILEDEEAEYM